MNLIRYLAFAALFLAWSAPPVFAEAVAGRDYKDIRPQPTESGDKIEVIEFFWYGCPHCNDLHPYLKKWLASKPADVDFRYVPAIFRDSWVPGAKLFYGLEITGDLNRLNDKVYDAIHLETVNPADEKALVDWAVKQGVNRKKLEDAMNSFSMNGKLARSKQMSKDYQLHGVPAIVVDGKYLTGPGTAQTGPEQFTPVLNEVIEKARKERAAAAKK